VLVALALPSCSPNPGEIALRIGRADRLDVLWYACSTNWKATQVRLYRLEGRFLGDGQDRLITSINGITSNDAGEDSVVWNARLPMRERLTSGGRYAVEVAGPSFGVYLDFRASQLATDRWLTSSGPMSRSDYPRLTADRCDDVEITLLVAMFLVTAIVVPLTAGRISVARSLKRGS
jgi:hypothetical protein